ncbi:MAG TPA: GGDEF domain-containing protein, partial [Methylophaga sp.]|nr:GGDEF domain-containing protein [Methylophaga sp.]
MDTPAEQRFDRITRLAKRMFDVPIALITLLDDERQ